MEDFNNYYEQITARELEDYNNLTYKQRKEDEEIIESLDDMTWDDIEELKRMEKKAHGLQTKRYVREQITRAYHINEGDDI